MAGDGPCHANGGHDTICLGRNRPKAQVRLEVMGKNVVRVLSARLSGKVVFYRRRDCAVMGSRLPVAKLRPRDEGLPEVLWSVAELAAHGLDKQALIGELASIAAGGAEDVQWTSSTGGALGGLHRAGVHAGPPDLYDRIRHRTS